MSCNRSADADCRRKLMSRGKFPNRGPGKYTKRYNAAWFPTRIDFWRPEGYTVVKKTRKNDVLKKRNNFLTRALDRIVYRIARRAGILTKTAVRRRQIRIKSANPLETARFRYTFFAVNWTGVRGHRKRLYSFPFEPQFGSKQNKRSHSSNIKCSVFPRNAIIVKISPASFCPPEVDISLRENHNKYC